MRERIGTAAWVLTALCAAGATAAPRSTTPARSARPSPGRAAPTGATRAMTPQEARTAVAMLDDAYHLILEETHAAYHTKPNEPVAASMVRRLQERMTALGWPRARFLAVNAIVMHPDHVARDDFDRRAVQSLRKSDRRVEQVVDGELRVATAVATGGSCFSCHWAPAGQASKAAASR